MLERPHSSWGLRRLLKSAIFDYSVRPWTWSVFADYPAVFKDIVALRYNTLLSSYLSIGLPGENKSVPAGTPFEVVKILLKALKNKNGKVLSRLKSDDRNLAVVQRVDELIRIAHKTPSLPPSSHGAKESSVRHSSGNLKILYVAHSSLIDANNGYSVRTHEIAKTLVSKGHDVHVFVRPSFEVPYSHIIDGVRYIRSQVPQDACSKWDTFQYLYCSAIEKYAGTLNPDIIHAASNHITGYAALQAAQKLGLPFIYEVRGFWEVTRLASLKPYGSSAGFRAQVNLESCIVKNADHVFTLNKAMVDEVVRRGSGERNVSILPNCGTATISANPEINISVSSNDDPIAFGYVGSFVHYEGLLLLVKAFLRLCRTRSNIKLILAGHGPVESLLKKAAEGPYANKIEFLGAVKRNDVPDVYRRIDIIVLPRRSTQVTNLVSALKPLEAFSAGIPCIVSDVRPFRDLVKESGAAMCFKAGSLSGLTESMREILDDPARRKQLGKLAAEFIREKRSWDIHVNRLIDVYRETIEAPDSNQHKYEL